MGTKQSCTSRKARGGSVKNTKNDLQTLNANPEKPICLTDPEQANVSEIPQNVI